MNLMVDYYYKLSILQLMAILLPVEMFVVNKVENKTPLFIKYSTFQTFQYMSLFRNKLFLQ